MYRASTNSIFGIGFVTATTNVNFLLLTGLNPDTCYNIYVRAVCSPSNLSAWSTQPPTVICHNKYHQYVAVLFHLWWSESTYANNEDRYYCNYMPYKRRRCGNRNLQPLIPKPLRWIICLQRHQLLPEY
jgi:hypothetical protein